MEIEQLEDHLLDLDSEFRFKCRRRSRRGEGEVWEAVSDIFLALLHPFWKKSCSQNNGNLYTPVYRLPFHSVKRLSRDGAASVLLPAVHSHLQLLQRLFLQTGDVAPQLL